MEFAIAYTDDAIDNMEATTAHIEDTLAHVQDATDIIEEEAS